jgi:phosphatidate cytidylyltransferase
MQRGIASSESSKSIPGQSSRASNLVLRIVTAAVGIPLVLAIDYAGGPVFAAAVALAAAVGIAEFCGMMRAGGYRPFAPVAIPAGAAAAAVPLTGAPPHLVWIGIMYGVIVVGGAAFLAPALFRSGLLGWTLTVVAVLYVGVLLSHLTLLRHLHHGAWWVLAVLVITWAYDTGAYFAGRFLGSHPFMAHVSPKKTLEGVLGGLALAGLAGLILVPITGVAVYAAVPLGLLLGAVAQIGDLIESMIKRQVGVKDSGAIFPGHGGLLDRIDSLLLTGALLYYAATVLGYAT